MDDADNIKPDRLDQTAEPTGTTAEEMDGDVVNEIDYETLDTNAEIAHDYSDIFDPADYPEPPKFGDPAEFLDTALSPTMYSKADESFGGAQIANSRGNSGRGFQSTENKDVDADRVDETSRQIHCTHSPPTALTGWVPTEAQIRLFGRPAPSTNSGLGSDYDSKHPYKVEDEGLNADRLDEVSKQIQRYRNPHTAFTAMPPTDAAIRLFGSPAPSTYSELDNDDNTNSASHPRLRLTFGQTCYTEDRINAGDEPETSTDSEDNDDDKKSSVPGPRLRRHHSSGSTNMSGNSPGPGVEEEMWSTENNMTPSTEAKQCADEEIEETADHSITGHALDTADFNDTVSNASMTAMEHDQNLEVLPQQIELSSLMLDFWFLLPAFLSLYFMDLPEFLVQWVRASMADLIPKDVQFTLQGFITTSIALMPLWIILTRLVIKTLHKALSPLGMFGYLGLLTMVLHCCNFKVLDVVFLWISNLVRYMVFGNWQMTYQLSFTVLFFSVPFFIVVGQALGIKVTHTIKDSWETMTEAAHGFITTERRPDQPIQSGLGTLSVLPPEIRSKIWQLLFDPTTPKFRPRIYETQLLGHADPVEDRKQMILSMLRAANRLNLLPDLNLENLAILRTSKQLHDELLGDLYRNRTLRFCFDNNEHGLLLQRLVGKPTDYYIRLGGFCVARDFANTDFSMFKSVHLDIELPSNECSRKKMEDLRTHLGEFSELIQAWQLRKYHTTQRKCPQIDIAIRLHKGTQLYDYEWSEPLCWEICIQDIERLLRPLRRIDNVEDVTIKVHFILRYGQEWLPQVLHEVIHEMKHFGHDVLSPFELTRKMCSEAYDRTKTTLGSEVGGPLSKSPADCPSPPSECSGGQHWSENYRIRTRWELSYPQKHILRTIRRCKRCNDHYFEYSLCRIERRKRAMLLTFINATVLIAAIAIIGMSFHALFKHADKLLSSGLRFKSLFKMIINLTTTLLKFTIDLLAPIDVAIVYFLNDGVRLRCHDLVKQDIPAGLSLDQEKILDAVIWTTIVTYLMIGARATFAVYIEIALIYVMNHVIVGTCQDYAHKFPNGLVSKAEE